MKHRILGSGRPLRTALLAALGGFGLWDAALAQPVPATRGRPAVETAAASQSARTTNFAQDFQSAMALYHGGKSAEAKQAFFNLLERTTTPRGADECLAHAAYCALEQNRYDEALSLAGRIKDDCSNRLCRMNVLRTRGKWDEILVLCRDEDLEAWPDRLIYEACLNRGRAYTRKRNAENAARDFLSAIRNTISADDKAMAYHFLGELYHDVAKDDQKALDAYGEAVKLGQSIPIRRLGAAATARARLLTAQGKAAQAIAELDRLKVDAIKDLYWRCAIQLCYGEVHESLGQKAEALARYKAVAACEKAPEALLITARKKIDVIDKKQREADK